MENPTRAVREFYARLCPHTPHPKQQLFIECVAREAFFGGGGGGGKSDAALMRLLKFAHVPGYAALCLRVNYKQMVLPDAIMARAVDWWKGRPGVHWDAQHHIFTFSCPGGGVSRIVFGNMESTDAFTDYQGAAFNQVLFEELTQFHERQYLYLFSRQRRPSGTGALALLPLFMGSTGNPGGVGHQWVFKRFINLETRRKTSVWIPSLVEDNPSLDVASYREALAELDPVTRAQLEHGSWEELSPGDFFDQSNFVLIDEPPPRIASVVRFWDLAGSELKKGRDPDATASCLMGLVQERSSVAGLPDTEHYVVLDVTEDWWPAGEVPGRMAVQAAEDTRGIPVRWELEGGSSGLIASEKAIKPELVGFDADGIRATGSKTERAKPFSARVAHRKVFVLKRPWTKKWMDQHHQFPAVAHDDMVDATSGAFNYLASAVHSLPTFATGSSSVTRELRSTVSRRERYGIR